MLEKSTESILDGQKDKHIDHREHQTGMNTGVKGDKSCIRVIPCQVNHFFAKFARPPSDFDEIWHT